MSAKHRLAAGMANRAINLACLPAALRFRQGRTRLRGSQETLLKAYLEENADTQFGRRYGFAGIQSLEAFRNTVPLSTWDDYRPDIDAILAGQPAVLTRQPVLLLEPTSGSTSGSKLIPYTGRLQSEFMAGIKPWLVDLYRHYPALLDGPAYWSISPSMALLQASAYRQAASKVPLGFADDAQYFGWLSPLLRSIFPVSSSVKAIADLPGFRMATMAMLLAAEELRLLSVWNPGFLTILLDFVQSETAMVLDALSRGSASGTADTAALRFPPQVARARRLARLLDKADWPLRVWPRLQLLSCWTQGQSAAAARELSARFPGVPLQGKGLLATEGVVTVPLGGSRAAAASLSSADGFGGPSVLAYQSHFFEFLSADQNCLSSWELEPGMEAEVVLTTGGGLYRYRLGDRIRVRSILEGLPVLDFLGRSRVSDLCGEKLSEEFITSVLQRLFAATGFEPAFYMLAPQAGSSSPAARPVAAGLAQARPPHVPDRPGQPAYCLIIGSGRPAEAAGLEALAGRLDSLLRENLHYDYARGLGQLERAKIRWAGADAQRRWQDFLFAKGMSPGQIKATVLYTGNDILDCFPEKEEPCT